MRIADLSENKLDVTTVGADHFAEAVLELKQGYLGYPLVRSGERHIPLCWFPKPRWSAIGAETTDKEPLKTV